MPTQREILESVARGEITPEEAADRLASLPPESSASGDESAPGPRTEPPPAEHSGVRKIVVRASACSVQVVGDSSVTGADASGAHEVRREGDTLVIEAEPIFSDDESDTRPGVFVFQRRRGSRGFSLRGNGWPRTQIRMNPDLPLDVDVDAGSITVEGVHGPIHCDVDAGSAKIVGFKSPIDVDVDAGSFTGVGVLTGGESRVRCDAGSAKVRLERGSDVRVEVDVHLGRAEIRSSSIPTGDRVRTIVLGAGTGHLRMDGDMSNIQVEAFE